MKYFFLYSPMFHEWPLAIARRLSERSPSAQFMGLVAGKERIYRRVQSHQTPPVRPLYRLYALEKEWISKPYSPKRLAKYEALLGSDLLNRLVVSSRQIGYGWITGGTVAKTHLMEICRDTEMVRRYAVGLLDFLFHVFEESKPDEVFCYDVADAPAYGLGKVCEHLGVRFRRLICARIGTEYIMDDTTEGHLGPVCRTFEKALKDPTELEPLLPKAKEYLKQFRSTPDKPEYQLVYDQVGERKRSLRAIPGYLARVLLAAVKGIRPHREWSEPTDWSRRTWQLGVTLQSLQLARRVSFRSVRELPEGSFAYFPLHIDPEATTMVYTPYQTNQLAIVEALSKSLPLGMDLVVKEHTGMIGRRPAGFYEHLANIPKVVLVSPADSTFDLIQRAAVTCVITGTAAWEAMMFRKPALVVGENFPYVNVGEGVVHCQDLSRLPCAISKAISLPPANETRLELFIASILHHSFELPSALLWQKVSPEIIQRNRAVLENICNRLEIAG